MIRRLPLKKETERILDGSSTSPVKLLNLESIGIGGGTQPRCEIDESLVSDYAEAMEDDVDFPPIIVFHDGTSHWLADGFHRYHAARKVGQTSLPAEIHDGTLRDAVLYSVGANAAHGKRRTNEDKRKAVLTLLEDEEWAKWSDSEIARRCAVHHSTVAHHRRQISLADSASELEVSADAPASKPSERTYTTRHGTEATMNTTKIGKKKPAIDSKQREAVAWAVEELGAGAGNRKVAKAAGVSERLVAQVRQEEPELQNTRRRQICEAAYRRLNIHIAGTVDGVAQGLILAISKRSNRPSKLTWAMEVAKDEDVEHWIEVLGKLESAARQMREAIKQERS